MILGIVLIRFRFSTIIASGALATTRGNREETMATDDGSTTVLLAQQVKEVGKRGHMGCVRRDRK